MKYLVPFLLLLAACGQQANDIINDPAIFTGVDPQLQVYFNRFSSKTGASSGGITAGFIALPNGIAGECVTDGPYREIRMDPGYWATLTTQTYSDLLKEQLSFHELGHCALGIMYHTNNCSDGTTAPDGTLSSCNHGTTQPLSIMNWMAFNYGSQIIYYSNNEPEYVSALVQNVPIP